MTPEPSRAAESDPVALSVVVITENEADNAKDCVESVFEACRTLPSFEVILVDSASTDRTVERAVEYPITVLRIPEEHTVSCGAGRFVGDRVASGEMVLHVDGDMVLTETWLPRAVEQLRDPEVAAVEGCLDRSNQLSVRDVDKVGGVMLYDAAALREVGGFDPFLLGYEDIDVGFKLKRAGYRLLRLPDVSAEHRDEGSVSEPLRRWKQGYFVAPGQAIRKWLGSPSILWRLLRRQWYKAALLGWLVVGALSLAATPLMAGWLLLSLVGFGVLASVRGVVSGVQFLATKAIGLVGLAVGLRRRTPPAEEYPVETVEVVSEGRVHEGSTASGGH